MKNSDQKFTFHHFGYACKDINEYKKKFVPFSIKNTEYLYNDTNQNVKALFIDMVGGFKIELIQILDNTVYCPIKLYIENHISGYHHICYESDDTDQAQAYLKKNNYRLVSKTENGFENRNIFFFIPKTSPEGPLIEIVSKVINN